MAFLDIIGDLASTLFGGPDDSAQDATKELNAEMSAYLKQQKDRAYSESLAALPSVYRGIQDYGGASLELLKNSFTPMMSTLREGNVQAQNTLGRGLDQSISAILGTPIDTGFTAPRSVDMGAMLPTLPTMPSYDHAPSLIHQAAGAAAAAPTPAPGGGGTIGGGNTPGNRGGYTMQRYGAPAGQDPQMLQLLMNAGLIRR